MNIDKKLNASEIFVLSPGRAGCFTLLSHPSTFGHLIVANTQTTNMLNIGINISKPQYQPKPALNEILHGIISNKTANEIGTIAANN